MAEPLAEAEQLAARLIEAESDDSIDVVALIDSATPAARVLVAAMQRQRRDESVEAS